MAIRTIQIDDTGDPVLDAYSRPTWLTGRDAITQVVRVALSLVKGNYIYDTSRGVDRQAIIKRNFTRQEVIAVLSTAILKVPYITEVIDIVITLDALSRVAAINFSVKADGEIVNGSLFL